MTGAAEAALWGIWLVTIGMMICMAMEAKILRPERRNPVESKPTQAAGIGMVVNPQMVDRMELVEEENRKLREQLRTYETKVRRLDDDAAAPTAESARELMAVGTYQELAQYHAGKAADYALIALVLSRDLGKSS